MARTIAIFDTTLRDGEQAPGCGMSPVQKLEVARRLALLGVDVIEAGFAASSPGELAAIREIAAAVQGPTIASLARALEKDIDAAWEAIRAAGRPRIHTFIATSPIHMEYKLRMGPDEVVERARQAVRYARRYCEDVEFSAEDASRSDPDFLCRVFSAAIEEGATVINVPDTVGYSLPGEFGALVRHVRAGTRGMERARLSVHCHDDLGLAVANSLAAIAAGADQVECTVNGIGERAGNAALEEIVMAMRTRADLLDAVTRVDSTRIHGTSRLVASVTGSRVQANKAVVGENAFAHEAGIHQHGVLANSSTYEIMTPESVGLPRSEMVLGKHSGRHAFDERLGLLGIRLDAAGADALFASFKELADRKKTVSDRDIEALALGSAARDHERWRLDRFVINSGTGIAATCAVRLATASDEGGERFSERVAVGDGPIDAGFKAIDKIVGRRLLLEDFQLQAVTGGKDAQGEARVRIDCEGRRWTGHGLSTDVVEASIRAYVSAINAMERELELEAAAMAEAVVAAPTYNHGTGATGFSASAFESPAFGAARD
jgi:2-isopropylmalate synthase